MADKKDPAAQSSDAPDEAPANESAAAIEARPELEPAPPDDPLTEDASEPEGSGAGHEGEGAEPDVAPAARRRSPWVLVLILLIVGFAGGVGATAYWAWREAGEIRNQIAAVQGKTAARVQGLIEDFRRSQATVISNLEQRISDSDRRVEAVRTDLGSLGKRLNEVTETKPTGLALAEVEHLLRMAQFAIALERDRDFAVRALSRAEVRLIELGAEVYRPVLEQLASDRDALEAAQVPDRAAIRGALSTLVARVPQLASETADLTPKVEAPPAETRREGGWSAFVGAVTKNLSQFVVVKQAAGARAPSLIPGQEFLARENLKLALSNARSAAVRGANANYRASLVEARSWLTDYFNVSLEPAAGMLSEIDRLSDIDLEPELPDVSASLARLRSLAAVGPAPSPPSSSDESEISADGPDSDTPEASAEVGSTGPVEPEGESAVEVSQ